MELTNDKVSKKHTKDNLELLEHFWGNPKLIIATLKTVEDSLTLNEADISSNRHQIYLFEQKLEDYAGMDEVGELQQNIRELENEIIQFEQMQGYLTAYDVFLKRILEYSCEDSEG